MYKYENNEQFEYSGYFLRNKYEEFLFSFVAILYAYTYFPIYKRKENISIETNLIRNDSMWKITNIK